MRIPPPGSIIPHLNTKWFAIIVLQAIVVLTALGYRSWTQSSAECQRCHSDRKALKEAGGEEFYITQAMVEEQSKHARVECIECHLGDGRATDKEKAHTGMLRMLIVGEDSELKDRKTAYPYALRPTGDNRNWDLFPKVEQGDELWLMPEARNILWHDRDPDTYNFDPEIAKKTCAKAGCHPEQLKQFSETIMGRNYRQRTMRTWTEPYGPHNCGPSFADLLPSPALEAAGFEYENTRKIQKDLNVVFTDPQAEKLQQFCNVCHAGCLDCHFAPREGQTHRFEKSPRSENCLGTGRGSSTCHPGAMQNRRGETYIGGDFSIPPGMVGDVHYKKDIHCIDCHPTGEKGMGDMERKASCQDCHLAIEESLATSVHKNLDCATCHIQELRGYQITAWGPGKVAEKPNPFKKYSHYYGTQKPPILIKDQAGKWMPVKVWPHSVGNIKEDVPASASVEFRWPKGETRDAYYVIGTVSELPEDNKQLLWIELQQGAHPFGKARTCESCHEEDQVAVSDWEFEDDQGAEPFSGTYTVRAGKSGIHIEGLSATSPIEVYHGSALSDFAPWLYMKDRWAVPGDFSIPTDPDKYRRALDSYKQTVATLKRLGESETDDVKARRRYTDARGSAVHNMELADKTLRNYLQQDSSM